MFIKFKFSENLKVKLFILEGTMSSNTVNIHAQPLDEIVNFIQGNNQKKKAQKKSKSQHKPRVLIDAELNKLREINADLMEVKVNVKQTQSQLNQLRETNGKNKIQKMSTAQNNLKNLNKRQSLLEKEAKTILNNIIRMNADLDFEKECGQMVAIKDLVALLLKKKKPAEKQQEKIVEDHKLNSIFGNSVMAGAKPPHFSHFNNAPRAETSWNKTMKSDTNGIGSLHNEPKVSTIPVNRSRETMHSYQATPSSCLVKNENGIYTVRKPVEMPNLFPPPRISTTYSLFDTPSNVGQNRRPRYQHENPLQYRDREIDVRKSFFVA